jgi:hypothetical protein
MNYSETRHNVTSPLLLFAPRQDPVMHDEFRISSLQAQDKQIQSYESVYWPRTEPDKAQWYWRQQQFRQKRTGSGKQ